MKIRSQLDPVLIFLASFLWFGFWSARGKTPFCDYAELYNHLGVHGLSPLYHWTYHLWIQLVRFLSRDDTFWTMMAYSSGFFASLNAVLIYKLCRGLPHTQSSEEFSRVYPEARVGRYSGIFAALFFGVSTPVLFTATIVQIHQVNVFLFLLTTYATLNAWKNVTEFRLLLLGLLTGFVLIEYMAAWVMMPFQVGIVGYSIWVSSLSTRRLSCVYLISLAAGLSLFIPILMYYQNTAIFEWRDFDGPMQLFRIYWRDHIWSLTKPLPRVGWILVFISTLMPFVWIAIPKRGQSSTGAHFGSIFLHIMLFITLCLTLLNSPIAPWELLGEKQVVLPYAAAAIAFGYLVGYIYILIGFAQLEQKARNPKALLRRRVWLGLTGVLIAFGAVQSLMKVNHRPATAIREFVHLSLPDEDDEDGEGDEESSTELLISGGWIARMQQPIGRSGFDVLDLSKARSSTYKEYLASHIQSTRLVGLARISIQAYVTELLQNEAYRAKTTAFNYPNLWMGLGVKAVPTPLSYSGLQTVSQAQLDQSKLSLEALSHRILPSLLRVTEQSAYSKYVEFVLISLSKTLNNLGVLYDEGGNADQALACYQLALEAYAENISAQLNQLIHLEKRDPVAFKIRSEELMELLDDAEIQPNIWSLAHIYGFVYHVQSYVQRGLSWASSGRSLAAKTEFQKAQEMGANQGDIARALSGQLLFDGVGSRQNQNALLQPVEDPEVNALLQSIHQRIMAGDIEEAQEALNRDQLESAPHQVLVLQILADLVQSRVDEALLKIRTAPIELQNHPRMLMLRIGLEPSMDADVVEKLETLERNGWLSLDDIQMLAEILRGKGNIEGTIGVYQRAVLRNPGNIKLLEKLVESLAMKGDKQSIRRYITAILELSPSNPMANRYLGMFQVEDGELDLAVDSFRTSYRGNPTADAAINLAWLLVESGEMEEAHRLVQEAIDKEPSRSDVYHTLGLLQLKKGHLEASEKALLKAIEIQPLNPLAKLYLAMLYAETGDKPQARILLDDIKDQADMMMPIFRERYKALKAEL